MECHLRVSSVPPGNSSASVGTSVPRQRSPDRDARFCSRSYLLHVLAPLEGFWKIQGRLVPEESREVGCVWACTCMCVFKALLNQPELLASVGWGNRCQASCIPRRVRPLFLGQRSAHDRQLGESSAAVQRVQDRLPLRPGGCPPRPGPPWKWHLKGKAWDPRVLGQYGVVGSQRL